MGEARYPVFMRFLLLAFVGSAGALALGACSSDVLFGGGSGGAGGAGGGAAGAAGEGGSTTSTGTGGMRDACPKEEPRDGGACMKVGQKCEYGDGPLVYCRPSYECTLLGQWKGSFVMCNPHPDQTGCPASKPVHMGACPLDGQLCLYGATQCGCTSCWGGPCGGEPQWLCVDPPGNGCPEEAPNFGQACSPEGLQCSYGACGIGSQAQRNCTGGVWVDQVVPCPE
jgi:hypothetical protein